MFGYRVPAPDQAMLISGGRNQAADGDTRGGVCVAIEPATLPGASDASRR